MNKFNRRSVAVAAVAAVIGGTSQLAAAADEPSAPAEATEVDVVLIAEPESEPVGRSTLRRNAEGVTATFQSGGFQPGDAVSLWWVVFNRPEHCSDPCNADDIWIDGVPANGFDVDANAATELVGSWAAGTIADDAGEVYFVARLDEGAPGTAFFVGEGATLRDTAGAVIHLVGRSHGPAIEGLEDVQGSMIAGGCDMAECASLTAAIHLP